MEKYTDFISALNDAVSKFKENKNVVKIVSHLDSDGISCCAIMAMALVRENVKFNMSVVKQLNPSVLKELSLEEYKRILFMDLGSGYLKEIEDVLGDREIYILDHHVPQDYKIKGVHINPRLFNLDGDSEISGSGVVYLFCKMLNMDNKDMAHIALIGAVGDIQEKNGFKGLNDKILADAVSMDKIEVKRGLSMFGSQTKPLHKVLEYSTSPYIPGVTGNEEGAINFLTELGIKIKEHGRYKKLIHLDHEDMKKLVTGIILKRMGSEENPEDILGPIYILKEEEEESPTRDAREFSTLLNASGRLNKPSLGVGTCLGSKRIKKKAVELLSEYKKEIIESLNWFYEHRGSEKVVERNGYVFIIAEDNIRDSLIGTLASIISKSNVYKEGTIIVAMAYTYDDEVKVSLRVAGYKNDADLRKIAEKIVKRVGGISGGHMNACGALIKQKDEKKFVKIADEILSRVVLEEKVK